MSIYFKRLFYTLLFTTFVLTSLDASTIESKYHAVDIAGKQRMYTQRILKDYAMIGMKNDFGNPDEDIKKCIETFSLHLKSLHDYTKNKEILEKIEKAEKIWLPIKTTVEKKPEKKGVLALQSSLENLFIISNEITKLFEKEAGGESGEIVNISGRQRMLSQKMASLYMLKVWDIKDEKFKETMHTSMKLFKESLIKLEASKLNNDEISNLLLKVKKSFMFFEIMTKSSSSFIPSLIYKKSNDILENMDSVTRLYVEINKK